MGTTLLRGSAWQEIVGEYVTKGEKLYVEGRLPYLRLGGPPKRRKAIRDGSHRRGQSFSWVDVRAQRKRVAEDVRPRCLTIQVRLPTKTSHS